MMKNALKLGATVGVVILGIIATGWMLDEAGKGTFGDLVKSLAQKTTRGYGV